MRAEHEALMLRPTWLRKLVAPAFWLRKNCPREFANLAITVSGVLAAALFAVVLDRALPSGNTARSWSAPALVLTAVAMLVLLLFVWVRSGRGTLYYVRLLDESMSDIHHRAAREAANLALDYRSHTRWIAIPPIGVVDLRCDVNALCHELETSFGTDDSTTAYELAPNVLFPASLAVGYGISPPPGLLLSEFNDSQDGQQEIVYRLQVDELLGRTDELAVCGRSGVDLTVAELRSLDAIRDGLDRRDYHTDGARGVSSVYLDVQLTQGEPSSRDGVIPSVLLDGATIASALVVDLHRRVGRFGEDGQREPVTITEARTPGAGEIRAEAAARRFAYEIWFALHEFRDATIIVGARASKAVAVGGGIALAHLLNRSSGRLGPASGTDTFAARMRPWDRIVPLYYDPWGRQYRVPWVWLHQTDPSELLRRCRQVML